PVGWGPAEAFATLYSLRGRRRLGGCPAAALRKKERPRGAEPLPAVSVHPDIVFQVLEAGLVIFHQPRGILPVGEGEQVVVPRRMDPHDAGQARHLRHFEQRMVVIVPGRDQYIHGKPSSAAPCAPAAAASFCLPAYQIRGPNSTVPAFFAAPRPLPQNR